MSIPTASAIDHGFTRQIVGIPGAVPEDVWLQVLCPCRLDLIEQTVRCLKGANKVILSLYVASSETFLETVFGLSQQEMYDKAITAVKYAKSITKDDPAQQETTWILMFSPEAFSDTELSYSLRLCEGVKSIWEPTVEVPIILNLPATVEMSTPNVYADQVEIFSKSISEREKVCVSLHPHNDRGCAVAAAELAQMAGADRVEGCLFGNGERAGNVDLVTLALNLYSQGIDPGVDLSDLPSVRALVLECTKIPVHPRAPYAGDLVFTAYSGAHQDAISKGIAKMKATSSDSTRQLWKVPYLAVDPCDLGSDFESIIKINSQSGKGGVAWTLSRQLKVQLPKGLQIQFSKVVKQASEDVHGILSPTDVANKFLSWCCFSKPDPRISSVSIGWTDGTSKSDNFPRPPNPNGVTKEKKSGIGSVEGGMLMTKTVDAMIKMEETEHRLQGKGANIVSAVQNALATLSISDITIHRHQSDISDGLGATKTLIIVECRPNDGTESGWGARIGEDVDNAELLAALSSILVCLFACTSVLRRLT